MCVSKRCEVCDLTNDWVLGQCELYRTSGQTILRYVFERQRLFEKVCDGTRCVECLVDSNGCSGATPICSLSEGIAQCRVYSDGECGDGLNCRMGACVECATDQNDCAHSTPICDTSGDQPRCRRCGNTDECPENTICFEGACEVCSPDDASRCPEERPYCTRDQGANDVTRYICSGCTDNAECAGRDPNLPFCVAGACHACEPTNATTCDSDAPICALDQSMMYTCRLCSASDECLESTPEQPVCSTEGATRGSAFNARGIRGCAQGIVIASITNVRRVNLGPITDAVTRRSRCAQNVKIDPESFIVRIVIEINRLSYPDALPIAYALYSLKAVTLCVRFATQPMGQAVAKPVQCVRAMTRPCTAVVLVT